MLKLPPTIEPEKFVRNLKTVSRRLIRNAYYEYLKRYYWKSVLWSRPHGLITAGSDPPETLNTDIQKQNTPT